MRMNIMKEKFKLRMYFQLLFAYCSIAFSGNIILQFLILLHFKEETEKRLNCTTP